MPDIPGWMSTPELNWLYETARGMQSIVEIGCWKGRSTYALLSGCPGTVHAVDHFRGSLYEREVKHREAQTTDLYAEFLRNVGGFGNLVVHRMASSDAAAQIAEADMVFIDGGHSFDEVCADLEAWLPVARKLICGHDYQFPPVLMAVHQYFETVENPVGKIWVGIQRKAGGFSIASLSRPPA
jgi:hypothetical protein